MPHPPTLKSLNKLCIPRLPRSSKGMCKVSRMRDGLYANVNSLTRSEFMPYIFQLFGALLESNPSETLPSYYQSLVSPILMPVMWESKGNIPALVRLLSSVISRGSQFIMESNQIEPILGIFQKLLSTKANESYGFDLLESVIAFFPS